MSAFWSFFFSILPLLSWIKTVFACLLLQPPQSRSHLRISHQVHTTYVTLPNHYVIIFNLINNEAKLERILHTLSYHYSSLFPSTVIVKKKRLCVITTNPYFKPAFLVSRVPIITKSTTINITDCIGSVFSNTFLNYSIFQTKWLGSNCANRYFDVATRNV